MSFTWPVGGLVFLSLGSPSRVLLDETQLTWFTAVNRLHHISGLKLPKEPDIGSKSLCPRQGVEHLGAQLRTLFPPKQT